MLILNYEFSSEHRVRLILSYPSNREFDGLDLGRIILDHSSSPTVMLRPILSQLASRIVHIVAPRC